MMNRVLPYVPSDIIKPPHLVDVPTAWYGCESILHDVFTRFKVKPHCALEFGVDYGYSTSALANFFNLVIGVDTFEGDVHAGPRENLFEQTQKVLKNYKNVQLVKQDYREWIAMPQPVERYDTVHIDVVHHYHETNELGAWAVQHSDVVLFHDTISFPDVRRAVQDIAWETGRVFYEWQVGPGLGFLVKE